MSTRPVQRLVERVLRNRYITWSVLAVLAALMLIEWQSNRGYRQTLDAIEAALPGRDSTKPLKTNEAEQLVHGWAWQYTESAGGPWYIGYRWPSLFRTYRIWLPSIGVWQPASGNPATGALITGELTADKLPPPPQAVPPDPALVRSLIAASDANRSAASSGFAQTHLGKVFQKCHAIYFRNPEEPEITDEFIEVLQSVAGELPKLELSTKPQEVTWNHVKMFDGGIGFSAFRFSSTPDQQTDLSWIFTSQESDFYWYILPAKGRMAGFEDVRRVSFPQFQDASIPAYDTAYFQTLRSGEIKPGQDYLVFFASKRILTSEYNPGRPKSAPVGLSVAIRLLPADSVLSNPAAPEIAELVGAPLRASQGGEILRRDNIPVQAILPTRDANQLILCDRRNVFRWWDLRTKSVVREIQSEASGDFSYAALSPDEKRLATATDSESNVLIWDLENSESQKPAKTLFIPWLGKNGGAEFRPVVWKLAFLQSRDKLHVDLIARNYDTNEYWVETVQWDVVGDQEIGRMCFGQSLMAPATFLGSGEQLVTSRIDGDLNDSDQMQRKSQIAFFDWKTGEATTKLPLDSIFTMGEFRLSPNEQRITVSLDNRRVVLDCERREVIHTISTAVWGKLQTRSGTLVVGWSPDSRLLAIAYPDNSIHVWDFDQDRLLRSWRGHIEPIQSLAFTSDEKWLVSSSQDGTVRLWPQQLANMESITDSVGMKLAPLPEGDFQIGTPQAFIQPGTDLSTEQPQHLVRISRPFYMGMHEVTVKQFRQFVEATGYKTTAETNGVGGSHIFDPKRFFQPRADLNWRNPGFAQADDHPVVQVSWHDAQAFCKWLSTQEQATYRLPTEAEWEYACRAEQASVTDQWNMRTAWQRLTRSTQAFSDMFGNIADQAIREHYKVFDSAMPHHDGFAFTAPVGSFAPNVFGLYDMNGNVFEWCSDWYDAMYYRHSPTSDPQGPPKGTARVQRSGGFSHHALSCRSGNRDYGEPDQVQSALGFRVVREMSQPTDNKHNQN